MCSESVSATMLDTGVLAMSRTINHSEVVTINRASAMVADRAAHFIWEALICSCVPALSFFGSMLCRCPLINILSAVGSPQVCETVNASKNSGSVTLGGRRVSVTRPDLGLVHSVGWIDLVEGSGGRSSGCGSAAVRTCCPARTHPPALRGWGPGEGQSDHSVRYASPK